MSNVAGKKLLVLGGSGVNCKYVRAAKELGVYTIVTDYSKDAPAKRMADEALTISVFDVDAIIDYCKKNGVDGVANFSNTNSQMTQQKVCAALGLPSYGTEYAYLALTDKSVFKNACEECGLDIIPEYKADDLESVEFPVLVKPTCGSGSRGISICYNQTELTEALEKAKSDENSEDAIIEKYMAGCPDFAVTYYTVNGEPYLTRVGDRYLGKVEDGLSRQCICGVYPSKYTQLYLDNFDEKMKNMIRKIGVQNGPSFFQGFIDGDTIRWYDPAIRFSGGEYEHYYKTATGVDVIKATVEYVLSGENHIDTEKYPGSYWLNGYHAVQLLVDVGPGTITKLIGFDEIAKLPQVAVLTPKHEVGDVIARTGDVRQRIAEIDVLSDCPIDDLINTVKEIQRMICVEDENGKNMLVSEFNADLLR